MGTANIIAVDLFKKMLNDLESKLTSTAKLKKEVKYNQNALNESLRNDFNQITFVLQNVVDKFYLDYYQVNGYAPFTPQNFEYSLKHNIEILGNAKKLIKFIN